MPGWATQVFSREFDAILAMLSSDQRALVLDKISEMGRRLGKFPQNRGAIYLITLGHRREIYR